MEEGIQVAKADGAIIPSDFVNYNVRKNKNISEAKRNFHVDRSDIRKANWIRCKKWSDWKGWKKVENGFIRIGGVHVVFSESTTQLYAGSTVMHINDTAVQASTQIDRRYKYIYIY